MQDWKNRFTSLFKTTRPIIGMVHLKPLPGSPGYDASLGINSIIDHAVKEALRLQEGGIDGIQIENQFDKPFLKPEQIGMEVTAVVTAAAVAVRQAVQLPLGVNIHLNGGLQALAAALACGAEWIRVFEMANAYISNSGIIEAIAPELLRYRAKLRAEQIMIFGDFHVKHGSHFILSDRTLREQAEDVETAGGDGLIVTGTETGKAPDAKDIELARQAVSLPVFIGSGLTLENLDTLLPLLDGAIVGSYFKRQGKLKNDVDPERVRAFMERVRQIRGDVR